ncbi:phospholipase D family protein [Reichenbachiella versicolor]|uniref:phospholipase D family protein n=1 Tax=Reichenbachiella versicolor TaxID=1821036 RepID=UPI000D6E4F66|nr:phospholipase D family protein [Reichenbachiella versicolor]
MRLSILVVLVTLYLQSCNSKKDLGLIEGTSHCDSTLESDTISIKSLLSPYQQRLDTTTGVFVLEDGGTSMISRAWWTSHATKTIDIQYFIFSTDNIGLIACDYLVKAAERGVKVRILIDDIMVNAEAEDLMKLNAHHNISLKVYNPGANLGKSLLGKISNLLKDFRSFNQRMHNKTFIVDNTLVITGGRNIADEYFDYDHEYNFRDRDIMLVGKATNQVTGSFEQYWNSDLSVDLNQLTDYRIEEADVRFDLLHEYACNPENFWPEVRDQLVGYPTFFRSINDSNQMVWLENIEFVVDEPGKNDGTEGLSGGGVTTSKLIELINDSKSSVDIQSPYLVTTELGKKVFKAAIDRGVKIRILTNSLASTDNAEAFSGYQKDRNELLEMGVQLYEFKPDAKVRTEVMNSALENNEDFNPIFGIHAKTMVIDSNVSVVGTFNLDPRSANLNTECFVVVQDSFIAKSITNHFEIETGSENAWTITKDFNPDSEVSKSKRVKTWTRKILPKSIL